MDRILNSSYHTAAKEHYCENCGYPILPGERYRNMTGLVEGDFYSAKEHEDCVALCCKLLEQDICCEEYVYISDWKRNFHENDVPTDLWQARAKLLLARQNAPHPVGGAINAD